MALPGGPSRDGILFNQRRPNTLLSQVVGDACAYYACANDYGFCGIVFCQWSPFNVRRSETPDESSDTVARCQPDR